MTNIEELLRLVEILRNLLLDPHPGLVTWRLAVNEIIRKINEFSA